MGDRNSTYKAFTLSAAGLIWLACTAHVAQADEIVRWVDADGVTHFSDPHLAAAPAAVVEVQPANGMAVPMVTAKPSSTRPAFTKLSKPEKKNKRGWRGYQSTLHGNNRGHRR